MFEDKISILIQKLHNSQKINNKELELKYLIEIAEYYYKIEDFQKSKLNFLKVLNLNSKIEGINYYLSLIELQNENQNLSIKYLKKELKLNKNNKYARNLLNKLEISDNLPVITFFLIFLNLLVFIFTYPKITLIELIKYSIYTDNLNLISAFTSIFFHVNLLHFLMNMIFLLMFGLILEKKIGSLKFTIIYLFGGVVGNFLQIYLTNSGFVIGASSAIFAIVGATLMSEPLLNMKIFGIIKVPMILVFGGFFAISSLILKYSNLENINSGQLAHIFGFLIGILIFGILYQETIPIFYNWIFVAIGFWIITFEVEDIILNFSTNNYFYLMNNILMILIGIFLILYSYYKLKLEIKFMGEEE